MASVAGLAPARLGLKARLLDRLCIHGQIMAAGVGLAPTPPVLQTGVQTLYTIQRRKMVVPAGNAPASPAYRAGALLLSYGTLAEGVGNAPTTARADPVFGTGAASLYLPAFRALRANIRWPTANPPDRRLQDRFQFRDFGYWSLAMGHSPTALAARVGLAPTPRGLTGRRATVDTTWQWRCRQESHLHRSV